MSKLWFIFLVFNGFIFGSWVSLKYQAEEIEKQAKLAAENTKKTYLATRKMMINQKLQEWEMKSKDQSLSIQERNKYSAARHICIMCLNHGSCTSDWKNSEKKDGIEVVDRSGLVGHLGYAHRHDIEAWRLP